MLALGPGNITHNKRRQKTCQGNLGRPHHCWQSVTQPLQHVGDVRSLGMQSAVVDLASTLCGSEAG
jgi:hypothetical protein